MASTWKVMHWKKIVAIVIFVLVTLMLVDLYIRWQEGANWPGPYFEKLTVTGNATKGESQLIFRVYVKNTGSEDATVTNICINNKTVWDYPTFIDVYSIVEQGNIGESVRSVLGGKGMPILVGEERGFEIAFTEDAFSSHEIVNVFINTTSNPNPYFPDMDYKTRITTS